MQSWNIIQVNYGIEWNQRIDCEQDPSAQQLNTNHKNWFTTINYDTYQVKLDYGKWLNLTTTVNCQAFHTRRDQR